MSSLPTYCPLLLTDAGVNWERMVTGQLFLSAMVTMFSDTWNCPASSDVATSLVKVFDSSLSTAVSRSPCLASQYLQMGYSPRIEHVVATYHSLCDDVRSTAIPVPPTAPSFPPTLLRPECQVVALLHLTARLNPVMVSCRHHMYIVHVHACIPLTYTCTPCIPLTYTCTPCIPSAAPSAVNTRTHTHTAQPSLRGGLSSLLCCALSSCEVSPHGCHLPCLHCRLPSSGGEGSRSLPVL